MIQFGIHSSVVEIAIVIAVVVSIDSVVAATSSVVVSIDSVVAVTSSIADFIASATVVESDLIQYNVDMIAPKIKIANKKKNE